MKRIGNIYKEIYSYENLLAAYHNAAMGRRYRHDVMSFTQNLEENLVQIQNELIWHKYKVGEYHEFFVHDPKKRLIMSLPFKDRVVQWAIYRVLNPIFDRRYINTSYGCRIGGGTHRAIKQLQKYIRITPPPAYVLKLDMSKYFYRVNHAILFEILNKIFKDKEVLWLMKTIIYGDHLFGIQLDDHNYEKERVPGVGMAIGNLTSQMFANLYLNELDQYCKHHLHVKHYIRYMDDIAIVSDNKRQLWQYEREIEEFIASKLALKLNNKTSVNGVRQGIDFCGYRVYRDHIKLRKKSSLHMKRRLRQIQKQYYNWNASAQNYHDSLMSYLGGLKHCDGYKLTQAILARGVLRRRNRNEKGSSIDGAAGTAGDGPGTSAE